MMRTRRSGRSRWKSGIEGTVPHLPAFTMAPDRRPGVISCIIGQ
jgi:hypothetical protein